ncbi:uncharacterized protein [Fopius arisanus]|uniref:Uncharacterized protein n=1 Tax=Fopius arisanus TaxID=64838 RepID=A0A9R1TY28_9HYME|nr:PREDICTED: uncharacterized protein LOC105265934 [Fopius arisanus]
MTPTPGDSWAVTLTAAFIRCCGFWAEDTEFGKKVMDIIVKYSVVAILWASAVTVSDLYHCYGDVDKFTYCGLNVLTVGFGSYKLVAFYMKRKMFLDLIYYAKKHFWFCHYDEYGAEMMRKCMRRCVGIILFGVSMSHLTIIIYYIKPLIGKPQYVEISVLYK